MIRRSCSWCHAMCVMHAEVENYCSTCGHRSDVPRSLCMCPQCFPTMGGPSSLPPVPELPLDLPPVPDHVAGDVVADAKITERYATPGSFSALLSRCVPPMPARIDSEGFSKVQGEWIIDEDGALLHITDPDVPGRAHFVKLTGAELVKIFDGMQAHVELKAWIKAHGRDCSRPMVVTESPVNEV